MVPAGNKAKRLSLVNHTTETIHHRHHRGAPQNMSNIKYSATKETAIAFCNGSNYNQHFIIIELPVEFEGQFSCLRENIGKCITF